jgi:hypothetical protein
MRMIRLIAPAVVAGLLASLAVTTPAEAHVVSAYYGNRGHAWTNSDHTRVGVEDQREDEIKIFVEGSAISSAMQTIGFKFYDENNNNPGHTAKALPFGYVMLKMRVCGIRNGASEPRGCGDWVIGV